MSHHISLLYIQLLDQLKLKMISIWTSKELDSNAQIQSAKIYGLDLEIRLKVREYS
jgi:hypothetical protein